MLSDECKKALAAECFHPDDAWIHAERLSHFADAVAEAAVRAEREGAVPVAWMHDKPGRVDVISQPVKELLELQHAAYGDIGSEAALLRPVDKVEHYTIPLYLHPPQASATVREGYALVPIEPTESMLESARLATESEGLTTTTWLRNCVYRAMIAAAHNPETKT